MEHISSKKVFEGTSEGKDAEIKIRGNCTVHADSGIFSVAENLVENAIEHGGGSDIPVITERRGEWCD